MTDQVNFNG